MLKTLRNKTYRYRYNGNVTRKALARVQRILRRLGKITSVEGKRWRGPYGKDEAVFVRGTRGTARFSGLLWGYGGEGPHGTYEVLKLIGLGSWSEHYAFRVPRTTNIGADWRHDFTDPQRVR